MSDAYPNVFSAIQVGPVEIPNRFYFPPHGNPLSAGGVPSDDFAHYYAERAAGGCGLLIQSLPVLPNQLGRMCPYYPETIPAFEAVADAIHAQGARIFGQLHYWWGSGGQWAPRSPSKPVLGSSAYQRFDHYSVTHEMTTDEIGRFVEAFHQSGSHLARAGYDGIEFHISHGILPEHFLSPYWNRRGDEYGGSLEGRMRFIVEALRALRDAAGSQLAVGIRFNCDEMLPGGWTQSDAREILGRLVADHLIDFADLDIAIEPNQFPLGMPNYLVPKHSNAGFVRGIREAAGPIPVLSALGRVTSVAEAEQAIADGTCDLVGAARGLMAEPELVKNAREGKEHLSRTCIACNWCLVATKEGAFGCAINPATGRERQWGVSLTTTASAPSTVVVVGGGPGGLEAARVAATRGHRVVVLEQKSSLGGQLGVWASLPGRESFRAAVDWWERELLRLGVSVRTGVEADAETVLAESPDAVVVASGSRYADDGESGFLSIPIPGADRDFVFVPEDILERGARPGGKVLILDDEGLNTGPGIAEILAREGASVDLVTRWMRPIENAIFTFEFAFLIPILKHLGVSFVTQTYVKEIGDRQVTLFDVFTNEERVVAVDAVVLATMRRPRAELAPALDGKVEQLFVIGDALAPRGFAESIYEGQLFARWIGEKDAPRSFADAYFARVPGELFPHSAATLTAALA